MELGQEVISGCEGYMLACYRIIMASALGYVIKDSLELSPLPIPELSRSCRTLLDKIHCCWEDSSEHFMVKQTLFRIFLFASYTKLSEYSEVAKLAV